MRESLHTGMWQNLQSFFFAKVVLKRYVYKRVITMILGPDSNETPSAMHDPSPCAQLIQYPVFAPSNSTQRFSLFGTDAVRFSHILLGTF